MQKIWSDSGQLPKALLALQYKDMSGQSHFTAIAIIIIYFRHALLVWIFTTAFLWHCVRHHWKMRKRYFLWKLNRVLLQNSDMYTAQLLLSPLFSIILSFLSEKEININDVLDNDPVLYPNIFLKSSAHDSCDLLFHICQKAILLSGNSKPSRASEIIHLVQGIIFSSIIWTIELSVKQISEKCCSGCQIYSENIQQIYEMHHYRLYFQSEWNMPDDYWNREIPVLQKCLLLSAIKIPVTSAKYSRNIMESP